MNYVNLGGDNFYMKNPMLEKYRERLRRPTALLLALVMMVSMLPTGLALETDPVEGTRGSAASQPRLAASEPTVPGEGVLDPSQKAGYELNPDEAGSAALIGNDAEGTPKVNPDGNPEGNSESNPDGNPDGNPEGNPDGNPEGNSEGNPDGNPEDNPDGNPEGSPEGNPDENPEETPEEPLPPVPVDPSELTGEIADVTIYGELEFLNEQNGSTNWSSVTRPQVFGQDISLIYYRLVKAEGENGEELWVEDTSDSVRISTQSSEKFDADYLEVTHDGTGGGSFLIENTPEYVVRDGGVYHLRAAMIHAEDALPYYTPVLATDITGTSAAAPVTLQEALTYTELTLSKEVIPASSAGGTYQVKGTFTPIAENTAAASANASYSVASSADGSAAGTVVSVPTGLQYSFAEDPSDEYIIRGYRINGGELTDACEGIATEAASITVVNISRNVKVPFAVRWFDNNDNANRPSVTGGNLMTLEYRIGDGEWSADLSAVGVTNPAIASTGSGNYAFVNLPGATADGDIIEYRISQAKLDNYLTDTWETEDGTVHFDNTKKTNLTVTVEWRDNNETGKRPGLRELADLLQLQRNTRSGEEEVLSIDAAQLSVVDNGNGTWAVTVKDLPLYTKENRQNEYSLTVLSSIGSGDGYAYETHYSNTGTLHYGPTDAAYQGGTIINLLTGTTNFTAAKRWADGKDSTPSLRPNATVTLMRYSAETGNGNADTGTDHSVARVTYYDEKGNGILLSYKLSKATEEEIVFNSSTINGLPADFALPAYDEAGRKYTYYVVETLGSYSGTGVYEIHYPEGWDGVGAPNGETIINLYREKAKIRVNKVWVCPADLDNVDGTEVQLGIRVTNAEGQDVILPAISAREGDYSALEDQAAATTITGFTRNHTSLSTSFYVNLYDESGHQYDLSQAEIVELVLKKDGESVEITDNAFEINGDRYAISSEFIGSVRDTNEDMDTYSYQLRNAVEATKSYTITKLWADSITEEEVAESGLTLLFALVGESEDPVSPKTFRKEIPLTIEDSLNGDLRTWRAIVEELPAYDENGYAYVYRATEASAVSPSGNASGWSAIHSFSEDSATVTNARYEDEGFMLYLTKDWVDNGDDAFRLPVLAAVYKKSEVVAAGGYAGLTPAYSAVLNQRNTWYAEMHIPTGSFNDYIVVEYRLGGSYTVTYDMAALLSAATDSAATSYTFTGSVITGDRNYSVTVSASGDGKNGSLHFTNTREGLVDVVIAKQWVDGSNSEGDRPETLQFRILQNGKPLTVSADLLERFGPENLEDNGFTLSSGGVVTMQVSASASSGKISVYDLPMFDANSLHIRYTVEEMNQDALSELNYISTPAEVKIRDLPGENDHTSYTYGYTNTKSASDRFTCYKVWQDAATNGSGRPDLYFKLYRYILDLAAEDRGASTAVEVNGDQEWIALVYTENQKHWRVEVENLPLYDEHGRRYEYYMEETMNNGGENSYGRYIATVENVEPYASAMGETVYAFDGGSFVNTIDAELIIDGVKFWEGIPGDAENEALPAPQVKLFRTLDASFQPKQHTAEELVALAADPESGIEYVDTTWIGDDNTYTFPSAEWEAANAADKLPKFSPIGERYYYFVEEVLTGLVDDLYDTVINKYEITNTLTSQNRRAIKVEKSWIRDGVPEDEASSYPDITFVLYRFVHLDAQGSEKQNPVKTKLKEQTITAAQSARGVDSVTFDDLLIYSPTGEQYGYYVEEKAVSGYTTRYTTAQYVTDVPVLGDITSITEPDVIGVENTYVVSKISLTGTKLWSDYSDLMAGIRPEEIELLLVQNPGSRIIDLTSGEEGEPAVTWERDGNVWSYTISNLVQYAPNGKAYSYTISEKASSAPGYVRSDAVTVSSGKDGDSFQAIENYFDTSYTVRKDWSDGSNKYGFRPDSVTMALLRSKNGTDYESIPWFDDSTYSCFDAVTVDGAAVVGKLLTADNVISNTNGNSWSYTFHNLPGYWLDDSGNTQKWYYRCEEVYIGTSPVAEQDGALRGGSYTVSYVTRNNTATQVRNNLVTTKLMVNKFWDNDQNNLYNSRPASLNLVLQQKTVTPEEELVEDWTSTSYTFTIAAANQWKATLIDLPSYDAEGNHLYFRAVEIENADGYVYGAATYKDITDYENDWSGTGTENSITLTNRLIYKTYTITASKLWQNNNDSKPAAEVTFELQYSTDGGRTWKSYNPKLAKKVAPSAPEGERTVAWDYLPMATNNGTELTYRIIEAAVSGYSTKSESETSIVDEESGITRIDYDFTNIENRGVLTFTKKSSSGELISHAAAEGESTVYFGVFTDSGCTKQVAGMQAVSKDSETVMVLTNEALNGSLLDVTDSKGVHYLQNFAGGSYTGNDQLALLAGTYYIKELRAPAGYVLDSAVQTAVIGAVTAADYDPANPAALYSANVGKVSGSLNFSWTNTENRVTIYKLDQYGRPVDLGSGSLLLTAPEGTTFLNGEGTIELKTSGNPSNITYNSDTASWTLTGVFDGDSTKVYTLSEPEDSVPEDYLQASSIRFTVGTDGKLKNVTGAESDSSPLTSDGSKTGNSYLAANNLLVLRDVCRYGTITLTKLNGKTEAPIANISFELYSYTGDEPAYGRDSSVLPAGTVLITDARGRIDLSKSSVINQLTGKALKYGLTIGKYYFYELDAGASDKYSVEQPLITFEITADDNLTQLPGTAVSKLNPERDDDTVINLPVLPKQLQLTKYGKDGETLKGAEFTLTFLSVTDNEDGSETLGTPITTLCVTDNSGLLVTKTGGKAPDISHKGTYTLTETRAPEGYITRVDGNGNPVVTLTFTVDNAGSVTKTAGHELFTVFTYTESADLGTLAVSVTNSKTTLTAAKRGNVTEAGIKTTGLDGILLADARLQLRKGTTVLESWTTDSTGTHVVTPGLLAEETVYNLHEASAPTGWAVAEDIYLKLGASETETSVLYIWTGTGTADSASATGWTKIAASEVVLTMVDEAIYAPVSLKKVVGSAADNKPLEGAVFTVTDLDSNSVIGTAKTGSDGFLVWDAAGESSDLTFNEQGSRAAVAAGSTIILQQNEKGYRFTEIEAPAIAHMTGLTYTVNITETNFRAYLADRTLLINAVNGTMTAKSGFDTATALNPSFLAAIELSKYDAEHEQINDAKNNYSTIGIPGTKFALIQNGVTLGTFTTGASGKLAVPIAEQGTYILQETEAAQGYTLPGRAALFTFTIVNSDYGKTLTYSETAANHTVEASVSGSYGVANERIHGAVELIKIDADTEAADNTLNEVTFTLTRKTANVTDTWFTNGTSLTLKTGYSYTVGDSKAATEQGTAGEAGKLVIENLQWGTYELTETQPDGYLPNPKTYTFTLNADNIADRIVVSDDGKTVIENRRNHLSVIKQDEYGNELWAEEQAKQAQFRIYPVVGSTVGNEALSFYPAAASASKTTTLYAGTGSAYCIPVGTYVLREIKAAEGYQLTDEVQFTMNADGTVSGVKTVSVENNTVSVAAESNVSASGVTMTVKDKSLLTEIPVTKVWDDADNEDGYRPSSIKLTLTGSVAGETLPASYTTTKTVPGDPGEATWSYTFTGLQAYYKGKEVTYTLTEAAIAEYQEPTVEATGESITVTNHHDRETTTVTVTKAWEIRSDDPNFTLPTKTSVQLYANGEPLGDPVDLTGDTWTYTWDPVWKNTGGKEIKYTVKEVGVEEETGFVILEDMTFSEETSGNMYDGYTITNTYETVTLKLRKLWSDTNDHDKLRPTTIRVKVTGNGKDYGTYEVKAEEQWQLEIPNLPKYDHGELIVWTVTEEEVPEYTVSYVSDRTGLSFLITNKHRLKPTETPKTGDASHTEGFALASVGSFAALLWLVLTGRKKKAK